MPDTLDRAQYVATSTFTLRNGDISEQANRLMPISSLGLYKWLSMLSSFALPPKSGKTLLSDACDKSLRIRQASHFPVVERL